MHTRRALIISVIVVTLGVVAVAAAAVQGDGRGERRTVAALGDALTTIRSAAPELVKPLAGTPFAALVVPARKPVAVTARRRKPR